MTKRSDKIGIGVIGCGHWGPNHIRVFNEIDGAEVVACADLNEARLDRIRTRYPQIHATTDYRNWLNDDWRGRLAGRIDAVVVATPTKTHAPIAREVLQAGKHVLVEKPLCMTSKEAYELSTAADAANRVLMVGHVFVFNSGIVKLREAIEGHELGRIQYLDAVRTNLGPVRGDVNALYDLGTHDISIFNYLLDSTPVAVSAHGRCITQPAIEDVCFVTLRYPDGTIGHIHVSWLNPRKVRTLTIVGEQKMAHWDDVDPAGMVRLYDKGLDEPPRYDSFGEFRCLVRSGDVHLPAIRQTEPLLIQAEAFVRWINTGEVCGPDARDGLVIAKVLETAMLSMNNGGVMCPIALDDTPAYKTATADAATLEYRRQPEIQKPDVLIPGV